MNRIAIHSNLNGVAAVYREAPLEIKEKAKHLFADFRNDHRSIVLWLCCIHQKLSAEQFGNFESLAAEGNSACMEKLERGIRFLVMRTLASKSGPLSKSRERALLAETLALCFATKEKLLKKVAAHASAEYLKTRGEIYLDSLSYADIARASLNAESRQCLTPLSELEAERILDFLKSFGDLRDYLTEAIHHHYKDILLRVCWLRHGPLGLVILGTLSAFLVPLIAWNVQANTGFKQFIFGWISFLLEHFH